MRYLLSICFLLLTACAPQVTQPPSPSDSLNPYFTITASLTQAPEVIVIAETPLPSPTPFTYIVQEGDTLSQIAEKFNVSLDELQAANPEISANSMAVGTVLQIPSIPSNPTGASTPTPVPVPVTQADCHPTLDRGLWCFALVHNDTPDLLENVSGQITLFDTSGAVIDSQTALLPLNILSPNSWLPLYVFFPPEVPADARPQIQLLTSIRLLPDDPRYLPAAINNTLVQIDWDGYAAQVSGQVYLAAGSSAASRVWVAAVAYDRHGRVVGVKRWEGGALQPGETLPFNFMLASLGAGIDRVEFAVEARP
jgi:hypothetical protein